MDDLTVHIDGSIVLDRDLRLRGSVTGTITVPSGRRLELHGSVGHDLIVEAGATVLVVGSVHGTLVNLGGDVELRGSAARTSTDLPKQATK